MVEVHAYPPNFGEIKKTFPIVETKKGVVYTYGGIIYNPDRCHIDEPLGLHEATHSLQQDDMGKGERGVKAWWKKFLKDPRFRFEQELEAYRNQYRRFCELHKDRNKQAVFLMGIARDLSSDQYGNCCTQAEAYKLIRERAETRR